MQEKQIMEEYRIMESLELAVVENGKQRIYLEWPVYTRQNAN